MHSYLKSIGFSEISDKKEMDRILDEVTIRYDEIREVERGKKHNFVEMSKSFGCDFGITVCGEMDENNRFQMEYYFPYFRGTGITSEEEIVIEKHAGKESYAGACDDIRIGVTMIFYVQNASEYLEESSHGNYCRDVYPITMAGLARSGTILFPVLKSEEQEKTNTEKTFNRNRMIAAARSGDEEAIENLTMEDIDTYSMIAGRLRTEDVYSIVDSYFIPYGMECDLYSVMGDITEFSKVRNRKTGEEVYELRIACNDIEFDVCINAKDLLGEPEAGRRFKGVIWLQGHIHFR